MFIGRIRLIGLMIACLLLGAAGTAIYDGLVPERHRSRRGPHSSQRLMAELSRDLRLSQDQKGQLEHILEESRQQMVELNRSMRSRFRHIREESRERIRGILSAEQTEQFSRIVQKWDERRRRRSADKQDSVGVDRKPDD